MSINLSKLKIFFFNNFILFLNMFIFLFISFTLASSTDVAFAADPGIAKAVGVENSLNDNDIYKDGLGRELLENIARLDGVNPDDPLFRLQLEAERRTLREYMSTIVYDTSKIVTEREIDEIMETYAIARNDSFLIEAARKSGHLYNFDLTPQSVVMQSSLIYFYPDFFLLLLVIFLIILNLFFKKYLLSYDIVNFNVYISLLGIFFTIFLLWFDVPNNIFYLNYSFVINNWVLNAKIFVLILVFFIFLLSVDYFKFEKFQIFEYASIILLSVLGMFILISSNDFIVLYLAVELQSFCFYILSALKRYSNLSIEASLKYFILGSFSSGILLFGISLIYGFFGTLSFNEINNIIFFSDIFASLDRNIIFAMLFITVGILFKLGVVPFHFWLPDVYEGSPTIVTALFSIVTKFSFLVLFIKVYFFVFLKLSFVFNDIFLFLALLSTIFGSIMSLYQVKIKRLLAYSAISHMGFILMSLSLFSISGLQSFLMYVFIYTVMSLNIFSIMLVFRSNPTFAKVRNMLNSPRY